MVVGFSLARYSFLVCGPTPGSRLSCSRFLFCFLCTAYECHTPLPPASVPLAKHNLLEYFYAILYISLLLLSLFGLIFFRTSSEQEKDTQKKRNQWKPPSHTDNHSRFLALLLLIGRRHRHRHRRHPVLVGVWELPNANKRQMKIKIKIYTDREKTDR